MTVDCYHCKRPVNVAASGCRACGSAVVRPRGMQVQNTGAISVVVEHHYAGVFARALAFMVDSLIVGAIVFFVYEWLDVFAGLEAYVDGAVAGEDPTALAAALNQALTTMVLAGAAVSVLYYTVMLSLAGRTLAGIFFRIKVVDAFSGGRVSPPAALIRALVANWNAVLMAAGVVGEMPALIVISSYTGLLVMLGYAMAAWDSQRQTLHDKIAGTVVVHG